MGVRERHRKGRIVLFFFFQQKTAYKMWRGLVGSEMWIRGSQLPRYPDDWPNTTPEALEAWPEKWKQTAKDEAAHPVVDHYGFVIGAEAAAYTHLTLPTTPYV